MRSHELTVSTASTPQPTSIVKPYGKILVITEPPTTETEEEPQMLEGETAAIETHVKKLSARLIESLLDLNLPVAGGVPGSHTGSIVCIGEVGKGGHDTTDDLQIAHLSKQLEAAGVVHTIRRGMVRLAFHLYNDESDIERVLDVARVHKAVG